MLAPILDRRTSKKIEMTHKMFLDFDEMTLKISSKNRLEQAIWV